MTKHFEQLLSPPVVNHAWRHYENDRGLWSAGLPVGEMKRDICLHIGCLLDDLRAGRYRPEEMRTFSIPKADGGTRHICAANVRDKVVQRAVLTVLEPGTERIFSDASFGFRSQCTIGMAHAKVRELVKAGFEWLVDTDIENCFDAVPKRGALRALSLGTKESKIHRLVEQFLYSETNVQHTYGKHSGLPQGMVLSPLLCNLYLHKLDQTLTKKSIPFVRFADDLIAFAESEKRAASAFRVIEKTLKSVALSLNKDKTYVRRSSRNHKFLGQRLPEPRRFVVDAGS